MPLSTTIMIVYLCGASFSFGYLIHLIPSCRGEKAYVYPALVVLMALGAAFFPITFVVAGVKAYRKRRGSDVLFH